VKSRDGGPRIGVAKARQIAQARPAGMRAVLLQVRLVDVAEVEEPPGPSLESTCGAGGPGGNRQEHDSAMDHRSLPRHARLLDWLRRLPEPGSASRLSCGSTHQTMLGRSSPTRWWTTRSNQGSRSTRAWARTFGLDHQADCLQLRPSRPPVARNGPSAALWAASGDALCSIGWHCHRYQAKTPSLRPELCALTVTMCNGI
jgi:hypothetical protein